MSLVGSSDTFFYSIISISWYSKGLEKAYIARRAASYKGETLDSIQIDNHPF